MPGVNLLGDCVGAVGYCTILDEESINVPCEPKDAEGKLSITNIELEMSWVGSVTVGPDTASVDASGSLSLTREPISETPPEEGKFQVYGCLGCCVEDADIYIVGATFNATQNDSFDCLGSLSDTYLEMSVSVGWNYCTNKFDITFSGVRSSDGFTGICNDLENCPSIIGGVVSIEKEDIFSTIELVNTGDICAITFRVTFS